MLVINSQQKEFERWMQNTVIKEPEKENFYNWIINSPVDIYIPKIPPVECSIGSYQRGFVFDILVHINGIDWLNYSNQNYISIDSEVINYLNWIGDIPTGHFLIDKRTGYFDKKAHKKISVYLIKEDEKFYEIEAQKSFPKNYQKYS